MNEWCTTTSSTVCSLCFPDILQCGPTSARKKEKERVEVSNDVPCHAVLLEEEEAKRKVDAARREVRMLCMQKCTQHRHSAVHDEACLAREEKAQVHKVLVTGETEPSLSGEPGPFCALALFFCLFPPCATRTWSVFDTLSFI